METEDRKSPDAGVVGRLAGRGEEAMGRLLDELGRNRTLTDGLTRALAAKGMLDSASRTALTQVGLAPAEDVRELRDRVMELERRLAQLEGRSTRQTKPAAKARSSAKSSSGAKTSARAKGTSASKSVRSPAPRSRPPGSS